MASARNRAKLDAASAGWQSENAARTATLEERLRQQVEEGSRLESRLAAMRDEAASCRAELAQVRDERAQFAERASRVLSLESRLAALQDELADRNGELAGVRDERSQLAERASRVQPLQAEAQELRAVLQQKEQAIRQLSSSEAQKVQALDSLRSRLETLEKDHAALAARHQSVSTQLTDLSARAATLQTQLAAERQQSAEKLALLTDAKEQLSDQFRNLANEILEDKSRRFAEQNQQNLGQLLEPLKERLSEFRAKVDEVYVQEGKDRSALAEQVRQLVQLNQTLSGEARNLTQALKGSNKAQGTWGELILERVLESSGLQKGQAYQVQDSQVREDGSRAQPDVVINLPGNRRLVVDAKMSLLDYERYTIAVDDAERDMAARQHLNSVRTHMKGLSAKDYHALYGLQSLDFVLMFVPIEPAFMLAVTQDEQLFTEAWSRNVLLVSPSTLLFVVRTVAYLWNQESQNRNAQEIAKHGADLYDKLVGFTADLQSLGQRLQQAQKDYDGAMNKFSTGRGNVIRKAEALRKLGVKPNKTLPVQLVQAAVPDDESAVDEASIAAAMAAHPSRLPSAISVTLPEPDQGDPLRLS